MSGTETGLTTPLSGPKKCEMNLSTTTTLMTVLSGCALKTSLCALIQLISEKSKIGKKLALRANSSELERKQGMKMNGLLPSSTTLSRLKRTTQRFTLVSTKKMIECSVQIEEGSWIRHSFC